MQEMSLHLHISQSQEQAAQRKEEFFIMGHRRIFGSAISFYKQSRGLENKPNKEVLVGKISG
jgi:hypothetical protein